MKKNAKAKRITHQDILQNPNRIFDGQTALSAVIIERICEYKSARDVFAKKAQKALKAKATNVNFICAPASENEIRAFIELNKKLAATSKTDSKQLKQFIKFLKDFGVTDAALEAATKAVLKSKLKRREHDELNKLLNQLQIIGRLSAKLVDILIDAEELEKFE